MTQVELKSLIVQHAEHNFGTAWAESTEMVVDLTSLYTFLHKYNATDFQADKVLEWYFSDIT